MSGLNEETVVTNIDFIMVMVDCAILIVTAIIFGFLIRVLIIDRLKIKNIKDIAVLITGCGSGKPQFNVQKISYKNKPYSLKFYIT